MQKYGCLLVALAQTVVGWQHASRKGFDEVIAENEFALVAFVEPAEATSISLEGQWDLASSKASDPLLSIDCASDALRDLCTGLNGDLEGKEALYPIIRLFHGGRPGPVYHGPGRAQTITDFLSRAKRPGVTELTKDALTAFQAADEASFVLFINPITARESGEAAIVTAFHDVASRHRTEFSFGVVRSPEPGVFPPGDSPTRACVFAYRRGPGDEGGAVQSVRFYDQDSDAATLEAWMWESSRPEISELTRWNHQRLLDRGWPMVYIFASTEAERADLRETLTPLATSYRDSLTVALVNPAFFPTLPSRLGLPHYAATNHQTPYRPCGALHQLSKDRIYPYPPSQGGKPITLRALQQFGLDVFQGRIKPWTPPGVTTSYDDLGPTRVKVSAGTAHRRIAVRSGVPGLKIKIAGHDHEEL